MLKKIKNIFFLLLFFTFIFLTANFYFSDENIMTVNKSRAIYPVEIINKIHNLPILKNDTADIIEYRNDMEVYKKKKKKYTFWNLLRK
tara:strand:+ start:2699 stop:2962 length:264 start_codon:yes stop_codon:yes gene_type:complete